MKNEKLLNVIGKIDDDLIFGAFHDTKAKKKNAWSKWGAIAACLCLAVAGVAIWSNSPGQFGNVPESGSGVGGEENAPGGVVPEGVDPVVASVAVIPAEESLSDVADATSVSIDEADAKNIQRIGAYLPDTLPEGCRYGAAGYYETTMKDGTQYHMIRVTYENGLASVPAPVTENAQAASEMTGGTAFLWMVWGHRPDTDKTIYQPGEVTARLLDQISGVFYIDYDGVYVGISRMEISTEELMDVIDSIG